MAKQPPTDKIKHSFNADGIDTSGTPKDGEQKPGGKTPVVLSNIAPLIRRLKSHVESPGF
ncbi:MAG: hypothetical protein WC989_02750 [Micavibrio sp.]